MQYTKIIALSLSLLALSGQIYASSPGAQAAGGPSLISRFMKNARAGGKTTFALGAAAATGVFSFVHRSNLFGLRTHATVPLMNLAAKYWENLKKGETKTLIGTGAALVGAGLLWYSYRPSSKGSSLGSGSAGVFGVDSSDAERLIAEDLVRDRLIAAAEKLKAQGGPMEFKDRADRAREALEKAKTVLQGKSEHVIAQEVKPLQEAYDQAHAAFTAATQPAVIAVYNEHAARIGAYIDALKVKKVANREALVQAIKAEAQELVNQ